MKIVVVGTGYVGLVTGTCFSDFGHSVCCVDKDREKVEGLKQCIVPIFEPGLEELVERNQQEGRLSFTADLAEALPGAEVVFIAVGTPPAEDGSADLEHVLSAAKEIAQHARKGLVVVLKSTVPPGSAQRVKAVLAEHSSHPCPVVSNPEFLKEGSAIDDFTRPDRVVIGGEDAAALELVKDLYRPFVRTGNPILVMDNLTAEMTKYASNAMLAARISFMNEIANLCGELGADVDRVRESMGYDRRIGAHFLFPGAGYGGSCFPKDVKALIQIGRRCATAPRLLEAIEQVNEDQKQVLFRKIHAFHGGDLSGKRIAVWGLAFKPKTDDMREAPSVTLIERLLEAGCEVRAHDPEAMEVARRMFGNRIELTRKNYEACEGADCLVIVTEWNEFRRPDFARLKSLLKKAVIFDGRNILDREELSEHGFHYECIGRPPISPGSGS
jgi:UDPglucose 6-dehydrogenase